MTQIFNSELEVNLRILSILAVVRGSVSLDYITTMDLFTTYGKNYKFTEENLHGDSSYNFSEIASRRTLVNRSLKSLVTKGLVKAEKSSNGFYYSINEDGKNICNALDTDYHRKYSETVKIIIQKTHGLSDAQLVRYATKQSINKEW